jgi:hypothetical protein
MARGTDGMMSFRRPPQMVCGPRPALPGKYVFGVGSWTPLPGREGLGEGRPCGVPVLATNLRPPCGPPLQGGRLRSLNTYAGKQPVPPCCHRDVLSPLQGLLLWACALTPGWRPGLIADAPAGLRQATLEDRDIRFASTPDPTKRTPRGRRGSRHKQTQVRED